MKIESIKIHNYKVFKDVEVKDISNMAVFLGKNGVGKTTFFDVVRPAAHVSFARHGRALAGESPEHAQVVGNV